MIRVLIVDDDFMVARVHQTYVDEVGGFEVVGFAHDGSQAVEAAERTRPDLVLLDIYLPDVNGLDLITQLRQVVPDLDVLIISAAREAESVRRALRAGITQYLIKPFSFEDLRDRLLHYQSRVKTMDAIVDRPDQADVDRVFGKPSTPKSLPKGLSNETLTLVRGALKACESDMSATEVGAEVSLSRASARRYLEHLVSVQEVAVRLRYGAVGRPERRYVVIRS